MIYSTILPVSQPYSAERLATLNTELEKMTEKDGKRACTLQGNAKVKCTLVQALRFYTGRTAHRGSRGVVLLFLDHGTRRG